MKRATKVLIFFVFFTFVALIISAPVQATSYGKVTIIGIGLTEEGNNILVFVDTYTNGYQTSACACTGWWFPSGTAYVFWMPRSGNEEEYATILSAYLLGIPMWFTTDNTQKLPIHGTIPCKIRELHIGDF